MQMKGYAVAQENPEYIRSGIMIHRFETEILK